ncbi:universal stress protein [Geodermatophilus sp. SYSU D00815]
MSAGPVVVGIDDTPDSTAAAVVAATSAARRGAPLRLVRLLPGGDATPRTAALGRLDAVRTALAEVLPQDAVTAVVRAGPPELVLRHESRTAALLVVPAAERELAATLVHRAACPVLLARTQPDAGGVVVGVDGGPGTAALLRAGVEEARARATSLLVLHAWDRPCAEAVEAAVSAAERDLLAGYVEPLRAEHPALAIDLRVVHAPPVEVLLRAARTADVVVLGRRPAGRRGETVDAVATGAAGPVLVVPLPGAARRPAPRRAEPVRPGVTA